MPDFQFLLVTLLQVADSANTIQTVTLAVGGINLVAVAGLLVKAGRFMGTMEEFKTTTTKTLDNLPCHHPQKQPQKGCDL